MMRYSMVNAMCAQCNNSARIKLCRVINNELVCPTCANQFLVDVKDVPAIYELQEFWDKHHR